MKNEVLVKIFLSIATLVSACVPVVAAEPNVVIERADMAYRFVADKNGLPERVEATERTTFRANRTPERAIAMGGYNDIVKLDKATGGEVTYGLFYNDDVFFDNSKAVIVAVDLKKAGAKGTASISTTYTKPEFFAKVFLAEPYDLEEATVSFEIPASLAGRYTFEPRNISPDQISQTSERKGNSEVLTFSVKDLKADKHSPDAPSRNITAPQIVVRGHFADVDALYRYLLEYIDPDDSGIAAVEAKAREVTAGCSDDPCRIEAITRFVRENIRYVAVEHGEFGHRPDKASEVLRKLYGDCKGSASLLRAMFRAVGLDGRFVWIGTTNIADRWTDLPSVCSGDHVIAAVVTADSVIFVDGTARYVRPGHIPQAIRGRQALIENGPERGLTVDVPEALPRENLLTSDFSATLTPEGRMEMEGTLTFSGADEDAFAYLLHDTPPARHDAVLAKLITACLKSSDAKAGAVTDNGSSTSLAATATSAGRVKKVSSRLYVDVNPMSRLSEEKFDVKERTDPGVIETSAYDSTLSLSLPDGMTAEPGTEKKVDVENEWFTATVETTLDPAASTLTRRLRLDRRKALIPASDLPRYNADLAKVVKACSQNVILTPAS